MTFGKRVAGKSIFYFRKSNTGYIYKWGCEILDLLDHDRIEKIIINKMYRFKCSSKFTYFKSLIRTCYDTRLEFKQAGNKAMSEVTKIIMNSLYGKLAQRLFDDVKLAEGEEVDAFFLGQTQSLRDFIKGKKVEKVEKIEEEVEV